MNLHISRARLLIPLLILSALSSCAQATATIQPPTPLPSLTAIPPTIELPSPTPRLTTTPTDTKPVWEIKENWTSANQIRAMLIDQNGDLWTGGPAGVVHWDLKTNTPTVYAIRGNPDNTNVLGLSQTPDGTIWVGTDGNGLAKFDGANWQSFTTEDGLPGNYIVSQTVSPKGEIWFAVRKERNGSGPLEDYGFGQFDGSTWIGEKMAGFSWIFALPDGSMLLATGVRSPGFIHGIGIFDGQTIRDLVYDDQEYNPLRTKRIKLVSVASDGLIWAVVTNSSMLDRILGYDFDNIYQYTNQTWVEVTPPWAGKDDAWISSKATAPNGVAWYGSSRNAGELVDECGDRDEYAVELGAYHYDGKTWRHFTTEDGLIDNKICAISIDTSGNVWFGSYDKGVSRFDGNEWTSFVVP